MVREQIQKGRRSFQKKEKKRFSLKYLSSEFGTRTRCDDLEAAAEGDIVMMVQLFVTLRDAGKRRR